MENHTLVLDNREKLTVTAVSDVDSASADMILITLAQGGLAVKGQDLHIQKLDLAEGKAVITGSINSAVYTEKKKKEEGGFLERILK